MSALSGYQSVLAIDRRLADQPESPLLQEDPAMQRQVAGWERIIDRYDLPFSSGVTLDI
jgi:hypothetical protein